MRLTKRNEQSLARSLMRWVHAEVMDSLHGVAITRRRHRVIIKSMHFSTLHDSGLLITCMQVIRANP